MSEVNRIVHFEFFRLENVAGDSEMLSIPLELSRVNAVLSYSSLSHVANARDRIAMRRPETGLEMYSADCASTKYSL
jgi:hypothetical protein